MCVVIHKHFVACGRLVQKRGKAGEDGKGRGDWGLRGEGGGFFKDANTRVFT